VHERDQATACAPCSTLRGPDRTSACGPNLAERYGWINRALPADALDEFVRALAHRIAAFPAAGQIVVKDRVNAISLAPLEDFRRDSDLFGNGVAP
jgi:enoyl-CoA hydratase/carnithine racemase